MSTTAQKSPAFFIRAVQKADAARVANVATPAAPKLTRRTILALVPAPTRKGGVRVCRVTELERFEGMNGSLVMETRALRPDLTQHYLPWHRMAVDTRAAAVKLRALLAAGLTPSAASFARAA